MRAGEVVFFLVFNAGVIAGLYFLQTRLVTKKLGRLKQEIQELEDLVVAIVEEFGEAVAVNPGPDAAKPELEANLKPELNQVQQSEAELRTTPIKQPKVISAQHPEVKPELINPQKPKAKAKPKSATKQVVTEIPDEHPILSQNIAESAPNSASKFSFPLSGVSDSKQQKVLNLAHQGMKVAEIAKQLKIGQGEIQLILGLYKKS
jgi:hypothetical protein